MKKLLTIAALSLLVSCTKETPPPVIKKEKPGIVFETTNEDGTIERSEIIY